MNENKTTESKWYLRTQDETFGPESEAKLIEWARMGRIQPGQEISDDDIVWRRVEDVPFLDMRFSIDIGDGNPRGPFNKAAAEALLASGRLPPISKIVEVRAPFEEELPAAEDAASTQAPEPLKEDVPPSEPEPPKEDVPPPEPEPQKEEVAAPAPVPAENANVREVIREVPVIKEVPVEKIVEKEVIREIPVVKEVIKEVPVEKIVEKEVIKEVPVEKIVEVEKVVVDEARVNELTGLLAEERRHTAELQARLDENSSKAAEAARAAADREAGLSAELKVTKERQQGLEGSLKDSIEREKKLAEQVEHLEDELRRLPQAASEVADIQAAMYALMSGEAEDLEKAIEQEKQEFEELKLRYVARSERLLERRRTILKCAGEDVGEMTRKALFERPEDPRTSQLRRELEDLRHQFDHVVVDKDALIHELQEQLRVKEADRSRAAMACKDMTQLQQEVATLREQLQSRDKTLIDERQRNEAARRQQAERQQTLLSRLAALESPSIGSVQSLATNQSREAKQVKLPGWMRLKG